MRRSSIDRPFVAPSIVIQSGAACGVTPLARYAPTGRAAWIGALILSVPGTPQAEAQACNVTPGDCCAGRPQFTDAAYAPFGSLVSIGTASPQAVGGSVLAVFDLGNPSAGPFNTDLAAPIYTHASWAQANLGSVFGVTLDPAGNIYVASTTCYSADSLGTLGGSGVVYRIDTLTSVATVFSLLPNTGPELGNLCYDCTHDQFFVSNMDDGKIYRLTLGGAVASTFDFGAQDVSLPAGTFAPLGERIWAVQVHDGRLYFSLWKEDFGTPSSTAANEIWSIALTALGDFTGAPRLEITLPPISGDYSNPVSDMRFTATGSLFLAERGMTSGTLPVPHQARLLEYVCVGGVWTSSTNGFVVGVGTGQNSAGGVDVNDGPCGRVYCTADALQFSPQVIYGTQGIPLTGGGRVTSVLVDYNGNLTLTDKTFIGDVAIPCSVPDACPPAPVLYCFGDGSGAACPCANSGTAGNGCANSVFVTGAHLATSGQTSISPDLLLLTASSMPNSSCLYFQGTTQQAGGAGVPFGDGLRCAGGVIVRLGVKMNSSGTSSYPVGGDLAISIRGGVAAGDVRTYQAWYRNATIFCTASTFNLTNGVQVTWTP